MSVAKERPLVLSVEPQSAEVPCSALLGTQVQRFPSPMILLLPMILFSNDSFAQGFRMRFPFQDLTSVDLFRTLIVSVDMRRRSICTISRKLHHRRRITPTQ